MAFLAKAIFLLLHLAISIGTLHINKWQYVGKSYIKTDTNQVIKNSWVHNLFDSIKDEKRVIGDIWKTASDNGKFLQSEGLKNHVINKRSIINNSTDANATSTTEAQISTRTVNKTTHVPEVSSNNTTTTTPITEAGTQSSNKSTIAKVPSGPSAQFTASVQSTTLQSSQSTSTVRLSTSPQSISTRPTQASSLPTSPNAPRSTTTNSNGQTTSLNQKTTHGSGFSVPEMASTAEGEPWPESTAEGEPEPGSEPGSFAEPEPDWGKAKAQFGLAWEVHIYGVGAAFALLAIYSLISIIRLGGKKHLLSQGYFISLNTIMFIMGTTRAVFFLIDGYNSNGTFPNVLSYTLYTLAFPCLSSAFSILFLALLQTMRMRLLPDRIQKTRNIVGIIVFHYLLSIVTDIVVGYFYDARIMLLICQAFFAIWGLFLFIGYFYIFRRLYTAALKRQAEMEKTASMKLKLPGTSSIRKRMRLTLTVGVKVTLITAILGVLCAGLQVYAMVDVYGVFSTERPEPWPWWSFKFSFRLIELAMCVTMSYVATQPFRYKDKGTTCSCFYLAPCQAICACDRYEIQGGESYGWESNDYGDSHTSMDQYKRHDPEQVHEEMVPLNSNQAVYIVNKQNTMFNEPMSPASPTSNLSESPGRPVSLQINEDGFLRFRYETGNLPSKNTFRPESADHLVKNGVNRTDSLKNPANEEAVSNNNQSNKQPNERDSNENIPYIYDVEKKKDSSELNREDSGIGKDMDGSAHRWSSAENKADRPVLTSFSTFHTKSPPSSSSAPNSRAGSQRMNHNPVARQNSDVVAVRRKSDNKTTYMSLTDIEKNNSLQRDSENVDSDSESEGQVGQGQNQNAPTNLFDNEVSGVCDAIGQLAEDASKCSGTETSKC